MLFEQLWDKTVPGGFFSISLLVVGLSAGLTAIIYMIGKIFQNTQMTSWSKDELYQLFGSIIIIVIIGFSLNTINGIILTILGSAEFSCDFGECNYIETRLDIDELGLKFNINKSIQMTCGDMNNPCQIAIAKSRLNSLFDLIRSFTATKMVYAGFITWLEALEIAPGGFLALVVGLTISFKPFAGASIIIESYTSMFELLFLMLMIVKAHSIFLSMVHIAIFPLFLVSGIILRTFQITRKLGGLLIAIALVLYFIYPMLIILSTLVISQGPEFPVTFENFEDIIFMKGTEVKEEETLVDFISSAPSILGRTELSLSVGKMIKQTALFSAWILFQQIVILATVIFAMKGLSPFFGGTVKIGGLGKLL